MAEASLVRKRGWADIAAPPSASYRPPSHMSPAQPRHHGSCVRKSSVRTPRWAVSGQAELEAFEAARDAASCGDDGSRYGTSSPMRRCPHRPTSPCPHHGAVRGAMAGVGVPAQSDVVLGADDSVGADDSPFPWLRWLCAPAPPLLVRRCASLFRDDGESGAGGKLV